MKIGCIGLGNMGCALMRSWVGKAELIGSDISQKICDDAITLVSSVELAKNSDVILIAVKPDQAKEVLEEIKDEINDSILLCVVAGLSIESIKSIIGDKKITRLMPNLPCTVHEMSAGYATSNLSDEQKATIHDLLNSAGVALEVDETHMDVITAVCGSAPAFIAYLIDQFKSAAIKNGLDEQVAYKLALQSFFGTAKLLKEKNMQPQELIDAVSSPNGTTVAGRSVLESAKVDEIISQTFENTMKRSKELSQ